MAAVEWAVVCETAFLDEHDRLCVIGITERFPVPSLPIGVSRLTMVGKLVDVRAGDEMQVGVAISTPCGKWVRPAEDAFDVRHAGEFLLITLRDVPLTESGTYRFALALGTQETVVDVPVVLLASPEALPVVH